MSNWKIENYEPELELINSDNVRKLAEYVIKNILPERAFYIEPSSTRRFHPVCTHKDGGLIIHTKRLIFFATNLSRAYHGLDSEKVHNLTDLYIVAGICHDMEKKMKYDKETDKETHANIAVDKLLSVEEDLLEFVDREQLETICGFIKYHMGPFEESKPMEEYTHEELLFYASDYLASRSLIEVPVDNFEPNLAYDKKFKEEWTYGGSK